MYYENKRSFYIRQYGPPVIAILISIVLISGGLFIATKSLENDINKEQIANIAKNETSADIAKEMPKDLANLKSFTKSKAYKVNSISDDFGIVLETGKNEYYKINLIGVESSSKYSSLAEKMKDDLVNKKVKIEFDTSKLDKNKAYAYVYLNNELYNTKLLENGYAVLRAERRNVDKLDLLLKAETQARRAGVGAWKA